MTDATTLALNLAQLKLELRRLTDPVMGCHSPFDLAVKRTLAGINRSIVECIDAVERKHIPSKRRSRSKDTAEANARRHSTWLEKQYQPLHNKFGRGM